MKYNSQPDSINQYQQEFESSDTTLLTSHSGRLAWEIQHKPLLAGIWLKIYNSTKQSSGSLPQRDTNKLTISSGIDLRDATV